MNVEYFALGLLSVLLIGSNVFWAKLVMQLNNRIMSRSYFEFVQTEKLKEQKPPKPESKQDDYMIDPEDERQAKELNALFNIA